MAHYWAAALLGIGTGFIYYVCVRLRMFLGPRFKEFAGQWFRQLLWLMIFVAVIFVANLSLAILRLYLHFANIHQNTTSYEAVFAVMSLITGLTLVFSRVFRSQRKDGDSGNTEMEDSA